MLPKGPEDHHPIRLSPTLRDMKEGCGQVAFVIALCALIVAGLLDGLSRGEFHRSLYKEFFGDSSPKTPAAPTVPTPSPRSQQPPETQPAQDSLPQGGEKGPIGKESEKEGVFEPRKDISPEEMWKIIQQTLPKDVRDALKTGEKSGE